MNKCSYCNSQLDELNIGNGQFYQCRSCKAEIYNFPMLRKLGYEEKFLKRILIDSKQNIKDSGGNCVSCNKSYRKMFPFDGAITAIFVCPTCNEFAISQSIKKSLPLKKEMESVRNNFEKNNVTKDIDSQIRHIEDNWKDFDEINTSIRSVKSLVFLFIVIAYSVGLFWFVWNFIPATTGGIILSFILFVVGILIAFRIIAKKSIFDVIRAYFNKL